MEYCTSFYVIHRITYNAFDVSYVVNSSYATHLYMERMIYPMFRMPRMTRMISHIMNEFHHALDCLERYYGSYIIRRIIYNTFRVIHYLVLSALFSGYYSRYLVYVYTATIAQAQGHARMGGHARDHVRICARTRPRQEDPLPAEAATLGRRPEGTPPPPRREGGCDF